MIPAMIRRLATILALAGALAAQQPPTAQSFFPTEYQSEFFVDFAKMRAIELWDGLPRPILAALLSGFSENYGFDIEDVDQLRGSMVLPEKRGRQQTVLAMIGKESVRLPTFGDDSPFEVDETEIGGRKVIRARPTWDENDPGTLYYSPRDGFLVTGHDPLVRPAIVGERKGGVPSAEILRHTAQPNLIAFFASHLNAAMREDMPPPVGADWLVEDDPLTFMMYALQATGEDGDEDVSFYGLLQCERGTHGSELIEKKIREGLVTLQNHRQFGAFKQHWEKVQVERDGREVRVRLSLGSPRRAGGALAQILGPMLMLGAVEQEVIVEPAAAPPKAAGGADRGKGKGEQSR
jgi:hypothetical protein